MLTELDATAIKVIDLAKALALADNHFLGAAIGKLKPYPWHLSKPLSTNGTILGIDSQKLCSQFKRQRSAPKHDLMHTVLHCIFLHPFVSDTINQRSWNLACDIAAECNVIRLCGERPDSRGKRVANALDLIESDFKAAVTAEKLYREIEKGRWNTELDTWAELFCSDDHSPWYQTDDTGDVLPNADAQSPASGTDNNSNGTDRKGAGHHGPNHTMRTSTQDGGNEQPSSNAPHQNNESSSGHGLPAGSREQDMQRGLSSFELRTLAHPDLHAAREEWSRIAKEISINLQTYSCNKGKPLNGMVDELEEATHDRIDYAEFLRQFAIPDEVLKVSEDEFDYIFYTYGLRLYDNLPLIEPLEYREDKRVREFVIIIDTSGSVYGEIVRRFIAATFDILKSTEAFFKRVHIRIIQCDSIVQSDDVITSLEELVQWGNTMTIHGCGGTDFRPAFRYVDELVENGAFEDLGGLIYFTDGEGAYPEWVPKYKVAFVYCDEDYPSDIAPPWAAQIVLDSDRIPNHPL